MAQNRAPKQWMLTKNETITTFESWRQNLLYVLSLDDNFGIFLTADAAWEKKTNASPNRGFQADAAPIPEAKRRTAVQKSTSLDLMLGQIANFCPIISRNSIVKSSTSLGGIWQLLRQHYGFQLTGSHFLDLANIKFEVNERPEDLFQRLMAFFEDNLLSTTGGITHHGANPGADEDLSPSLENTVVVLWLQLINPGLPQLVKQRYGTELRNKTLASLKPEISQALESLLDDLKTIEEAKVLRTASSFSRPSTRPRGSKTCTLCQAAKRPGHDTHFLSTCKFLPQADRRAIAQTRLVHDDDIHEYTEVDHALGFQDDAEEEVLYPSIRRVEIVQSPYLNVFYKHFPVRLTLDTGATTNMIKASFAKYIGVPVIPASQLARQADGITPLNVIGEVHCQVSRGKHTFHLDALVVEQLDVDVLAGNPFHALNDIATRPAKREIIIGGSSTVVYGQQKAGTPSVRRTQAYVMRSPSRQTVLLPGDYVEVQTPEGSRLDEHWALEPRFDTPSNKHSYLHAWPPHQEVMSVNHTIRIPNKTPDPVLLRRNEHFCQVRSITQDLPDTPSMTTSPPARSHCKSGTFSDSISLDPANILPAATREKFSALHSKYAIVFNPTISKYNGRSGNIEGHVNMGPVLPPQRKGRLPMYNRNKLDELQQKFDDLESLGVFAKPEDVGITVEYLNLSFLVQKPNGGSRLVTSFGEVGQYSKPQPALMPNVDNTLREIGKWKYIIVSDLLKSFYQIPLSKSSMKYCGVTTPYKGIRVYQRCAMGMPGSETCLEELMSRVLGELIQEGIVAKLADDLYCGGDTPEELLTNWERVLNAMQDNNLRLSAHKTVICPKVTTILGWLWSQGTLKASPHRIAALSAVDPPSTVHGLRSFIGAYKVLSRVLHGYADLLQPLDNLVAGRQSRETITWTDELRSNFIQAQHALADTKTITLPRPSDEIWIVTDGSVKKSGIGATLYLRRKSSVLLGGFFNAKMKQHQIT